MDDRSTPRRDANSTAVSRNARHWSRVWRGISPMGLLVGMLMMGISLVAAEAEKDLLDEFIQKMSSESKEEKRDASYRISQMGPAAQKALPVLIKALEERDDQIWFNAITALARIGPGAKEAVPALVQQLEQANRGRYRTRSLYRSSFALGSIGPAALPAIQKALSHDQSFVRAGAAKAITWIGEPAENLIPDLIKNLSDTDDDVRANAAEALGTIGQKSFEPLLTLLHGDAAKTESKVAAVEALGWMRTHSPKQLDTLVQDYEKHSDPLVQAALIRTLDKWHCEPARFLPILVGALPSEHDPLRKASVDALVLLETPSQTSVPALLKLIDSGEQPGRERAIQVLGAIGPDAGKAAAPLEKLMNDQSLPEETRQACQEALAAIKP